MPSSTRSTTTDPAGDPIDAAAVARRREVALAGHVGDEATARSALGDAAPTVRSSALGALQRLGTLGTATLLAAFADPAPEVRRRACELAATRLDLADAIVAQLSDPDATVVEAACFALGELGPDLVGHTAITELADRSETHPDPLCREAAVAALGAIGDPRGLAAVLRATTDRPAIRRRAVLALAPFDGPEVDAALARALGDRDWQVRQAAEDLTT